MKIYHSSDVIVSQPDTRHSRKYLDFGKGFYLTTIYEQAEKYAQRFLRRNETLGLLKFEKPNIQYCIRSEKMIKECLTYLESIML